MSKRWVTKCEYYKQTKNVLLEGENSAKKKRKGLGNPSFCYERM